MSPDDKKRIADFFTASELVEFVGIRVEDVIEAFEGDIDEALDDIDELIGLRHGE